MKPAEVSKASGFTAKEIASLADRGIIPSSGGGTKGKWRTFTPQTADLCRAAKMLIDDMGLSPADAFRIADGIMNRSGKFGRFQVIPVGGYIRYDKQEREIGFVPA